MKTNSRVSRRTFLSRSAQTAAALSLTAGSTFAVSRPTTFTIPAEQVRGIAISPDGRLAIAADQHVAFHSLDGRRRQRMEAGRPARSLCFDKQGRLFITYRDQVARLTDAGTFEPVGKPLGGRQTALTGLAIADNGAIFAADSGEQVIWRLNAAGALLGEIKPSEKGFAVSRAFFPVAWREGQLLVAEPGRHRVHSFTAEGRRINSWGAHSRETEGFSGCCNPVALATHADGTVVTVERGQPRVKVFTAEGRFARLLAGPDEFGASERAALADTGEATGCEHGLLDVAVSPEGRVVVLDRTTREVRVLA